MRFIFQPYSKNSLFEKYLHTPKVIHLMCTECNVMNMCMGLKIWNCGWLQLVIIFDMHVISSFKTL